MKSIDNNSSSSFKDHELSKEELNVNIIEWYLSTLSELNIDVDDIDKSENYLSIRYPSSLESYFGVLTQLSTANHEQLLFGISTVFSSMETLKGLNLYQGDIKTGLNVIIDAKSNVSILNSEELFALLEIKIAEFNDQKESKICLVEKLIDNVGNEVTLSKSIRKVLELVIKEMGYEYYILPEYNVDKVISVSKDIPRAYVIIPNDIKDENSNISKINIEKCSKLLLNTIIKIN